MNRRRTISWLAGCAALIALITLAVVFTTCGSGGAGRSKSPEVPRVSIPDTGTVEWIHTWGGDGYYLPCDVALDADEDIYIAGSTSSFGAGGEDVLLLKYDSNGNLLWQKTWGGSDLDRGYALAVDVSSDVYVTGVTKSFGAGDYDVCLLKYSPNGNLLWQRTWASSRSSAIDYVRAVDVDLNGSVYVAGSTEGDAGSYDVLLLKYSSDGGLLWGKTWGGRAAESGYAVRVDENRELYVAGATDSFGVGERDAFLLKCTSDGNLLWARTWGGFDSERVSGLAVDNTGDFYVAGYTRSFDADSQDAFLLKYSSSGSLLWQKTGGWSNDYAYALAVDGNGNVYVAGELWREEISAESDLTEFGPGRPRVYSPIGALLLKCSSYGDLLWKRMYASGCRVDVQSITVDGSGKVIVVGRSADTCGDWWDMSGVLSSPSGTETTPEGIEGTPEGTETIPEGTETEPEGVIDQGGILIMKYDPS